MLIKVTSDCTPFWGACANLSKLPEAKKQLTIRLDENTIAYFKSLAEKSGVPYRNLINVYLRECAESGKALSMRWS